MSEQDFPAALIGGAVAMLLAAAAYAIVVATRSVSHGFAAAAIGIVVGLTMQFLGRGIVVKFPLVAAIYAIAGCLLGNFFRAIFVKSLATATSPIDVVRNQSFSDLAGQSISYFSLIDLVYWFVAVFFAAFLAGRRLSRAERLAVGMLELRDYRATG